MVLAGQGAFSPLQAETAGTGLAFSLLSQPEQAQTQRPDHSGAVAGYALPELGGGVNSAIDSSSPARLGPLMSAQLRQAGERLLDPLATPQQLAGLLQQAQSSDIDVHGRLMGLGDQALQSVVDSGLSGIENWAQTGFSFLRSLHLDYRAPLAGRESLIQADVTVSLWEGSSAAVFGQGGLQLHGDEGGANVGLGYRKLVREDLLVGANLFYDYLSDPSLERWSVGAEIKTELLDFYLNRYQGTGTELIGNTLHYSPDGWDAELAGRLPQLPWAELGLRYYRWDGQRGDVDLEGLRWRLLLQPVPLFGVRFELDRPESGESSDFGLEATLEYQFGVPLDQQLDKAEVRLRSPWERRYERAHREYQIRARSRQVAVGAPPPGTGAARLLTSGSGAGVYGVNVDGSCAFQDGLIDRIVGSLREGSQACLRLQLQASAAPSQDSAGTLQAGERVRILFEGAASAGVDYELGQVRVAEGDGMVLPVDASAASFEAEFAEQRQLTLEIVLNALTDGSAEEAELIRMRPESGVAEAVLLIVDAAAAAHVSLRLLDDGVSTEGRPDDPARFEIALDRAQAAGAGALTVSLSVQPAPAEDDYTVFSDVSTTPLSPVGGNVYELNFEEGVQRREFRLQANEDADMDSETLSLSLTEPSDGSYLPVSDAVDVLLQDTDLPMLNLVATGESEIDEETDEAGRTRQLELQVTPVEHPRLTVAYTVSGGQRADFTLSGTGVAFDSDSALGGRIELAQNVGSVQITLVVSADTQTESAEELVLTLQPDPEQYLFAEVASARYTIAASDALEVSALALSPALAAEGENYTVSVTLSQSPGTDLELGYTITPVASSLVQPDDFADLDELSGTLRVPAGTPAGTAVQVLELALAQDGLTEGDENFLFQLAGPGPAQAYTLATGITFIERQITDASFSEVEISSADPVATEETVADSAEIVVTLGPTASGIDNIQVGLMIDPDSSMIAYTVTDAGGTVVDFSTGTAMLSFPAGTSEQSQTLSVALSADDGNTTNETLAVNLQSGTGYQVGSVSSLELILQDDDLPELTLGRAGGGPLMQGDTETLTLTVSPATHPELTVSYTVTGTVAAADYELSIAGGSVGMLAHDGTAGIGTITVPQDAAEVTLTLALATDMEVEGAETLSFRLSLGDGYRLGSPDRQSIDVAASGEVMISALTLSPEATMPMGEGGAYTVSMTLSASPSLALRVPYRISSVVGSIELDDFDGLPALTGELRVPAGTAVGAVQVLELRLEQDGRSEVAETFAFQLDPAPIGAPPYSLADDADDPVERPITDTSFSSARLIVEDRITVEPVSSVVNEASVEVVLAATDVAVELPVQFTPDPSIANYAVRISSGQLSISGGTTMLSFPASTSEQRQTLFIFALIDDLDTISDIVEIRLSDPAPDAAYVLGLPFEANIQLIDDDVPQVSVSSSTGTADEGAAVSLRLALLSHNRHPRLPAAAYTISGVQVGDFELAGDFDGNAGTDDAVRTALTGTVVIPESTGSSGVPLTLTLVQDATTEGAETLTFTLMDGPGYTVVTGGASIIINDTSRTPVASISTTDPLTESNLNTATLTVTLTDTEYVQASSLNAAQFTLVTTVPGVTVDTISRMDATNVVLTLAYTRADFDTNATLGVTVADAAHTGAGDLDTGTVPVTAVVESSNAQLNALVLLESTTPGPLTPAFTSAMTSYTAMVANSVSSLTVTPTAADAGASITVNTVTVASGVESGPVTLNVGANPIAVVVTAADGSTMTYTVTVTRMTAPGAPTAAITASNPSSLSESNLNTATLTVTLTNTAYEPSLNAAQFTLVTAVLGVTVNTVGRTDGTNAVLTLAYDGSDFDTTAMLVVTVADAAHTGSGNLNTDAVTVTAVDESTDANLNALELSVGVLDPPFDSATTAYAATVENSVSSLTVTPTASDATGASITVDDVAVVSGMASGEITLDVGENPIAVEVTAEDGNTMTYTVMVTRRGPPTAAITATDPSPLTEGNLDGARLTVTLTNTAYEAGLVANLFTLNTDVPGVTVSRLSFIGIGSGLTGVVLTLGYDRSNFDTDDTLAVTVADAAHTGTGDLDTGTVPVTAVAESSDAQLNALVLLESTTPVPLTPAFTSAMTSYTAMVANSVSELTVTPTASDAGAIITVNTVTVASSVASGPVTLNVGPNPIAVVVTAADGSTMTYTVTVTRLAAITFGGDTAGAVTEDDNAANTATGTLTVTNPGGGTDVVAPTEPSIYGTFAIVADTGDWTYTLDNADDDTNALPAGDVQMETFTIATVADPNVTQVVTITINGANDAPTVEISAPTGSPQVLFGAMLTLTATGEDPDTGATLTYAWSANPDVGSFANATIASTTWTAPASGTDSATLTLTVTDNAGSSASASFDITLVGPEASITAPSSLSVDEVDVNGAQVTVTLANTEYVASPIAAHFELSGTSGFVMIGGVDRVVGSDTEATLTLSYDRASVGDITDQLDITITLLAAGHTGDGDLLAPETLIIVPTPDLAPTFGSDTINPQTYTVSAAVDVTLPAATGGDGTLNYTLAPALPDGLAFNGAPASRTIIGTPTTVTAEATYTYTATDSDATSPDSEELTFTLEVVAAATDLMPTFGSNTIGDLTYTVDTAVSVTLPEATGGDGALTHAISAGTLPTGLAFNPTTRVLEGTPTVVQASMDYTYTATDSDSGTTLPDDSVDLDFTITIEADSIPTFGSDTINPQTYTTGTLVDVTLPAATGGDGTLNYTLAPALPDGLTFNGAPASRTIIGTPTTVTAEATYTYTVTDTDVGTASDSEELMFTIEVVAPAPDLMPTFGGNTIGDLIYTVQSDVSVTLPEATSGDGALTYAISAGTLPTGLAFNPTTRVLEGTPTVVQASMDYTYTATDSDATDPDAVNLDFTITIEADSIPTFGSDTISPQTYTTGTLVDVTLPAATGGDGTLNYTLAPALPDGLTFNGAPASRTIIGTPTTVTAEATYTYTVTDTDVGTASDSEELMFTIEVVAPAPDLMPTFGGNTIGDLIYTVQSDVSVTLPEATSGDGALTYAISAGTLPTGLAFNPTTRVLEGTPTVVQASMDYTYTATDSDSGTTLPDDSVDLDFTITIEADSIPTFGSDTINPQTYTTGTLVDVTLPAATGGDGTLNYTLAPALPDGLTFNGAPASRTIIGTPTTVTAEATYTYTVTDTDVGTASDSEELMFTIEVVAPAPDLMPTFGGNTIGDLIYTVQSDVSVTLPEATSGDGALTHAISAGTLPTGLAFNPTTRVLEGTPTVVQASMDYTYTATDSDSGTTLPDDSVDLDFTITITAAPTATIDTPSSLTEAALLAGATVTVMLTDTEYVGTLAANLFTVTLSGSGVTVSTAARTSNVLATLTLAYGGTGIDADTTLGITVLAAAHNGTGNLDTALIPVTATPPSLAGATFSVAENATAATTVGTPLVAAEFPSGTQTWAIVSGNDDGDFNIAEATGQLTVAANDSINFEDTPSYTLEVSLTIGTATAQATVTVTVSDEDEVPAAPAAPTVTAEVESLAVSWTAPANNGPAITRYDVQYRTGGGAFTLASPGPGTATSLTITGLTASTLYEVQVRATNAEGDGPYSALGTGTPMAPPTLTATISAPTTAIAEAALSGAELVVTLSNTEYVGAGSLEAVQFTINHGTGASGVTVSSVVRTGNTVATLTLAYTSGIDADTTLGVTVAAAAHTGDDALTTDNTVMVTATPPSLAGATFTVPENTAADMNVGTPLAAAEFPSGTQTWAIVSGNDDGDFNIAEATGQLSVAADDSINFEDTPSYTLEVSLTIGAATAQATVTVTVTDEDEPPSAPAAPTVTPGVESLAVTWTAPDNNGPAITGYNVEYRLSSSAPAGVYTDAGHSGTTPDITIPGLTASMEYQVRVRATNAEGDGPYSALGMGTPMAPTTPTATISAPTTAIAEADLSGTMLAVTLSDTEYVGTLEAVQFTINHGTGASGVTVSSVVRTGNTVATLTLAYTSGIDADTTLGVTVAAAAHTGDDALITDNMVMVTATAPSLTGATFTVAENTVADTNVGTPLMAAEFPSGTQTWAIVSGNDDGDFNIAEATGQLTVAANDSINFEDTPSYTLMVSLMIGTATAQATVTVTVSDEPEPPSAPAAPTVTAEVESLAVTWTAPANNGPAITGYDVRYRVGSTGAYTDAADPGTATSLTITGLTAATLYEVQVRAVNAEGDGAYSAPGTGTPMAPTTPTATISAPTTAIAEAALSGTTLEVTLSDTEYVGAGSLAAVQFTINHGTGGGVTVSGVVRTGNTVTTLTLAYTSGIDADTTLGVTVAAAAHTGDDALITDNMVMVTATPPSLTGATFTVPENTVADTNVGTPLMAAEFPSGTQTWAIVSGNDDGDFNIAEATGQLTVAANDSINFEDTPSYTLEVSLTIGAATAQATVAVTVDDVEEPPSAPAAPTVTPGVESLAVTWTAPDNNGPAITGYNVEYRLSSSAPAGAYTDAGHSGTTPDITIPGLTASMEYQVRVRATNAEGDGPYSALGMGTPMAPTTPTATISAPTTAIAEADLSGTMLAVTLSDTEYVGTLEAVQFTINHGTGASGVTVSGVVRTSPTVATLTLAYTSGIDADTTLGVTVAAAAHTGDDALTTDNTVMVTATPPSLAGATFTVAENTAADTDVGTPLAAAEFPSGTQTWAIVSGNDDGDFNIAEATGQLTVAANDSINFEDTASYTLVVSLTIGTAMAQATVTVTVSDENEPPLAPAAPTVTAAAESLNVNWTAPANNGPEITSYDVQYRTGADAFTLASPGPGAATSLTITGLTASTLYEVQVRAVNAEGMSTYSAPGTGTPLSGAAPTAVISATNPDPLTEDNLVGATLTVTLMNTAYVGSLSAGQFTLDTAVPSVTVDAVSRTGATNAVLMLAYDEDNFDNDATLGVLVAADAHTGANPLITNRVSVTANTPPMITGLRIGSSPITDEIMVTAGAAPVFVQVIAVDMTDEAGALTYSLLESVPDYVTISNSGLITVDPFELIAAVPTETFRVRVMDDGGETDERDFNLTVVAPPLPVNSPPQITSAPFMLDVIAGQSQSVLVSASDPDAGDMPTIAVTASDDPDYITFSAATGLVTVAPPISTPPTTHAVSITVSDGAGSSVRKEGSVVRVLANPSPILAPINTQMVQAGTSRMVQVTATDNEGDPITYSVSGSDLVSIDPVTGLITIDARAETAAALAPVTVTVRATGGVGGSFSERSFELTITAPPLSNLAPVITPIGGLVVLAGRRVDVPIEVMDPDGNPIELTLSGTPPAYIRLLDETVVIEPPVDTGAATHTVTVTARDGFGGSDSEEFSVVVSANSPPVISVIDDVDVQAGASRTVQAVATDVDGDPITYGVGGSDLVSINSATGLITIDAGDATAAAGPVTITVTAMAATLQDMETFALTITAPPTGVPALSLAFGEEGDTRTGTTETLEEAQSDFLRLILSEPSSTAVTVSYEISGVDEGDYELAVAMAGGNGAMLAQAGLTGTVEIPPNAGSVTLALRINLDSDVELAETLRFELVTSASYSLGDPSALEVQVPHNGIPEVRTPADDPNAPVMIDEGAEATLTFQVDPAPWPEALTVSYQIEGAADSSDYVLSGLPVTQDGNMGTVTIPAQTPAQGAVLRLMATEDGVTEQDAPEVFTLLLTDPVEGGYSLVRRARRAPFFDSGTFAIRDTSFGEVSLSVSPDPAIATEGVTTEDVVVTATFSNAPQGISGSIPVFVEILGSVGNPMPGDDYEVSGINVVNGDSRFAMGVSAGMRSTSLTIRALADNDNDEEALIVRLVGGDGYKLGAESEVAVTLRNAQPQLRLVRSGSGALMEGAPADTLTLTVVSSITGMPLAIHPQLTVPYTISGPGITTADYTLEGTGLAATGLTGTVVVPAGSGSVMLMLSIVDDGTAELEESLTFILDPPISGYTLAMDTDSVMIPIAQNGMPAVAVTATPPAKVDEGGSATLTLALDPAGWTEELAVNYAVSGTGITTADYTLEGTGLAATGLTGRVTIPASTASGTVTLTLMAATDAADEETETLRFMLSMGTGYTVAGPAAGIIIRDVVAGTAGTVAPDLSLTRAGTGPVQEGAMEMLTLTVAATPHSLTVPYTISGTGITGDDYTLAGTGLTETGLTGMVVIPADAGSVTLTLSIAADGTAELAEQLLFTLSDAAGYDLDSPSFQSIEIPVNGLPEVRVTTDSVNLMEGGSAAVLRLALAPAPWPNDLDVGYRVVGTNVTRADYDLADGTATVSDRVQVPMNTLAGGVTVLLSALADNTSEGTETFRFELVAGFGYALGTSDAADIMVSDDSLSQVRLFSSDPIAREGEADDLASVAVTLPPSQAAIVDILVAIMPDTAAFSVINADGNTVMPNAEGRYELDFPAGSTSQTQLLRIRAGDDDNTDDETLQVSLVAPESGAGYRLLDGSTDLTVILRDDDMPEISVRVIEQDTETAVSQLEEGAMARVRLALTSPAPATGLEVTYAIGGVSADDFVLVGSSSGSGVFRVDAGMRMQDYMLSITDDTTGELAELLTLTLTDPGATARYTVDSSADSFGVTIPLNDRPQVVITADVNSLNEGSQTTVRFRVVPAPWPQALSVRYTLGSDNVADGDFRLTGDFDGDDGTADAPLTELTPESNFETVMIPADTGPGGVELTLMADADESFDGVAGERRSETLRIALANPQSGAGYTLGNPREQAIEIMDTSVPANPNARNASLALSMDTAIEGGSPALLSVTFDEPAVEATTVQFNIEGRLTAAGSLAPGDLDPPRVPPVVNMDYEVRNSEGTLLPASTMGCADADGDCYLLMIMAGERTASVQIQARHDDEEEVNAVSAQVGAYESLDIMLIERGTPLLYTADPDAAGSQASLRLQHTIPDVVLSFPDGLVLVDEPGSEIRMRVEVSHQPHPPLKMRVVLPGGGGFNSNTVLSVGVPSLWGAVTTGTAGFGSSDQEHNFNIPSNVTAGDVTISVSTRDQNSDDLTISILVRLANTDIGYTFSGRSFTEAMFRLDIVEIDFLYSAVELTGEHDGQTVEAAQFLTLAVVDIFAATVAAGGGSSACEDFSSVRLHFQLSGPHETIMVPYGISRGSGANTLDGDDFRICGDFDGDGTVEISNDLSGTLTFPATSPDDELGASRTLYVWLINNGDSERFEMLLGEGEGYEFPSTARDFNGRTFTGNRLLGFSIAQPNSL